ncbi:MULTISPECIES: hypothetical protein [Mycobacterium]|uniref:hypothetical protein n=1 Tax=Mycobacterium TaxID=1763 RepID=UPI00025D5371|nr:MULTISPECIES: hypothetical protein [Mycobacterium]AFJ35474.1 hypothetical protein W7S_12545 [Mycobacterium sp. MOTT36Y]ASX00649.1 hypothetical protein CKJ58_12550 [Mycobacterium intracellulare subsp. chimaera]ELR85164.1 hypothetical protein W7U_08045 [Mycobacterium sp. H4Y]PBA63420.1 hypothetical protein CKJ56_11535 [Mycobacterium intracellulare subsp. chimaera]
MSGTDTGPEATHDDELDPTEVTTPEDDSGPVESDTDGEQESEALAKVRREAKNLRDRAKTAEARVDELSRELFALKVSALDKLADATDLAYDPDLLDDDKLAEAVDALVAAKPHMAKPRKPNGSVGQGQRGNSFGPMDFSSLLR